MTALQPGSSAPYTTAVSVTTVMDAYRDRGLGVPVTAEVIARAGVSETIATRTLNSLKALGLVGEDGNPTSQFDDLHKIRDDAEYRLRLQEWLRGVYADVLQYADPSADGAAKVAGAFRGYEPAGQRPGMAALLIGLWRYAGLPTPDPAPATSERRKQPPRPSAQSSKKSSRSGKSNEIDRSRGGATSLPPALVGLLQELPNPTKGWTEDRRDQFIEMFKVVLNYAIPIRPDEEQEEDDP